MKKISLLTLFIIGFLTIPTALTAQELYKEATSKVRSTAQGKVKTKAEKTIKAKAKDAPWFSYKSQGNRRLAFDMESVILRGDIRVGYEIPNESKSFWVIQTHINPHTTFNDTTGSLGFLGGAKYYLVPDKKNPGLFFQILGGLNQKADSWNPAIELTLGYSQRWQKSMSFEYKAQVVRLYHDSNEDPLLYLSAGINIKLNKDFIFF